MLLLKSLRRIANSSFTSATAAMSTTTPAPNLPGLDLPLDYYTVPGKIRDGYPTALDSSKLDDGYCR